MNRLFDAMTFHTAKKNIKRLDSAFFSLSDNELFSPFFHQPLYVVLSFWYSKPPFEIHSVSFPLKWSVSKFPYQWDSSWGHYILWNYRIIWVGRHLWIPPRPTPLQWAGTSSTRPGCSESHKPDLECSQGLCIQHLSDQTVLVIQHPHCDKISPLHLVWIYRLNTQ